MATVTFWLNAFIPRIVPGYTIALTAGPHSGKTAIPLPGQARLWPGNTFKPLNTGYLTDQRGFDNSPSASRRMQSMAVIDLATMTMASQAHTTSGTTEVNTATGAQQGFAFANMSRCAFAQVPNPSPSSPFGGVGAIFGVAHGGSTFPRTAVQPPTATIELVAQAGDPLVGLAADIDFTGTLTVVMPSAGVVTVTFQGLIDDFPAYDCYASFGGAAKTMFTSAPPPGNTVVDLLGSASRPIGGTVTFA